MLKFLADQDVLSVIFSKKLLYFLRHKTKNSIS